MIRKDIGKNDIANEGFLKFKIVRLEKIEKKYEIMLKYRFKTLLQR